MLHLTKHLFIKSIGMFLVVPPWPSSCKAGQLRIRTRTSILAGANVEVGGQLRHLSSGFAVRSRAKWLLLSITEMEWHTGREAPKPRSSTKPDGQTVAEEGVELRVHSGQRNWGPFFPGTAGPACLKVAGYSRCHIGQRLRRGTEAGGPHVVGSCSHRRA